MNAHAAAYAAIDLKSFYASVECVEQGLNPMTAHLVVADESRTEKTICLAVSPALKALGIGGRARLFEVVQKVREVNRMRTARGEKPVEYIAAKPRMALYLEYSARIYQIYLQFVAPEDIHVYSVDEVFIDLTKYLRMYQTTAEELTRRMIRQIFVDTGIVATGGVGTNLFLCKVAMDMMAKHAEPDADGIRIAVLDEMSFREQLWSHTPLTDFWRIGRGTEKRLNNLGLYTLGDVARCSLGEDDVYYNEDLLYRTFGVNAELLIDHAWGWEPCTMADIKAYKPDSHSTETAQVLQNPYPFDKARLVIKEMADRMALDLFEKKLTTESIGIAVGFDVENMSDPEIMKAYDGPITKDWYGRKAPKAVHGSVRFTEPTNSSARIMAAVEELFDELVPNMLLVRRMTVSAGTIRTEEETRRLHDEQQMDLFADLDGQAGLETQAQEENRQKKLQEALVSIQGRYGRNSVLRGMNLEEGATAIERNGQIGGHKA